ncbi:MAG: universal stress protein [Negativicutes bacterium]|jgi:universal stress protein
MNYKKILVPLDGSEASRRAMDEAMYLAGLSGATLLFLHVVDLNKELPTPQRIWEESNSLKEWEKAGAEKLSSFVVGLDDKIRHDDIVEVGSPGKVINRIAQEKGCDLILMGSRGLNVLENIVLGSVSQYVLAHAPCPVMVVR